MEFKIGKLSEETGINVDTLRYYEKQGLVLPIQRRRSGYRIYNDGSIKEVEFIKRAQALGFNLSEIKQIIEIDKHKDNIDDVRTVLRNKSRDIKKLLSDASRITRALNIIDAKCSNTDDASLMDLVFSDEVHQITNLTASKNTYLLEESTWNINGQAAAEDGELLPVVGLSTITHDENIWTIRNDFVIAGGPESQVIVHVPPIVNDLKVSRYVGNCCIFGEVAGVISVSADSIFKCYEMPEYGFKGVEHLKKLSSEVYDVSGIIIDGKVSKLQWQYQLERTETSVPSS